VANNAITPLFNSLSNKTTNPDAALNAAQPKSVDKEEGELSSDDEPL